MVATMTLSEHPPGAEIIDRQSRILTIDIERAPGLARFYDARTDYIGARSVVEYPRTICFAARWYGQKRPIFAAEWIDRDAMIQKAWDLYDEADIVYTYNGKRFDDKHLQGDWITSGLTPPRPWKAVDLFAVVKANFAFEHKSLDAVSRKLGRPGKIHPFDMQMAVDACNGNREAQRQMRIYNVGDIELTEWLADRLRPWMTHHPRLGAFGDEPRCNRCGSGDMKLRETRYRAVLIDFSLWTCQDCGGHSRGAWHARAASTRGVK